MDLIFLSWIVLGPLVGYAASQRRGFSAVGGVIGGILLGPVFSFLMFFVSGVASSSEQKKCPFCAEWIKPEAVVCKHCHKDIKVASPAVRSVRDVVVDEGFTRDSAR